MLLPPNFPSLLPLVNLAAKKIGMANWLSVSGSKMAGTISLRIHPGLRQMPVDCMDPKRPQYASNSVEEIPAEEADVSLSSKELKEFGNLKLG